MKRHLAFALVVLVATPIFMAAQAAPMGVVADVPFSFMAGEKSLPAGSYRFVESSNGNEVTISSATGKTSLFASVITRISPRSGEEAEVVFDVVGNDHFLSEVFVPGFDGYLLKATSGKHTHAKIKAKK